MTTEAGELERGWRLVESRGTPATDTVAADPLFDTAESPMVGLDPLGARHLLIPIDGDTEVSAITGAAVFVSLLLALQLLLAQRDVAPSDVITELRRRHAG